MILVLFLSFPNLWQFSQPQHITITYAYNLHNRNKHTMLNVHPMQLTHAPEFRIHLDDDQVILHGTAEESAGVILRGSIILTCHEQTKVKSITLKFIGITNVNWSEGKETAMTLFPRGSALI